MKRVKNHNDCKKETNHEFQREFMEKNIEHYKGKINTENKKIVNDHSKVMKEKNQLISIVNQLEKERREIQKDNKNKSVSGISKPRRKLKADVPKLPYPKKKTKNADEEERDKLILKEKAEELKALVKEVEWYKYWAKKKKLENKKIGW